MTQIKYRVIPQEILKAIACVTMLLDHIGAALVPWLELRIIGRLAFPVYCFLMAEGIAKTRNPKKYGLRLLIGAVLSEIPFDLLFFGKLTLEGQSVMVTLLLAFLMIQLIRMTKPMWCKVLTAVCFVILADILRTDYGAHGVVMVGLFALTRNTKHKLLLQTAGLAWICWELNSAVIPGTVIPIQMCAVAAMVPIALYSGRKLTGSRVVQWGFYLFYPVHLAILLLIWMLMA